MTCAPERIGDLVWRRRWNGLEILADTIHQAQSSGLPESGSRTTLDQSTRRLPLPESNCVRHRRTTADNGSRRLNVRAMVEENVDDSHVIATCSPVEGSLRMAARERCLHIGAGGDERRYGFHIVGEVTRPVRSDVEQGALVVDPCIRKIGIVIQQLL
jgi:hypothetical protein